MSDLSGWSRVLATRDNALSQSKSPRGNQALHAVYRALEELRKELLPITVVAVADRCPEGPTAASIRNSHNLRHLIQLAAQAVSSSPKTIGTKGKTPPLEETILLQIPNSSLRSQAEIFFAERRRLVNENSTLRLMLRRVDALATITPEMATTKIENLEVLAEEIRHRASGEGRPTFSDDEQNACEAFLSDLSPTDFSAAGLKLDEASGAVINKVGRTIAFPGVVNALRTIATNRKKTDQQ